MRIATLVGQGGPHLLPADQPLPTAFVKTRLRFDIGQVGAGAGLRVTLAPQVLTAQDTRQVALFLLRGAKGDQGGAGECFADMAHPARTARPGILLVEDHLLLDAGGSISRGCASAYVALTHQDAAA